MSMLGGRGLSRSRRHVSPSCLVTSEEYEVLAWTETTHLAVIAACCPLTPPVAVVALAGQGLTLLFLNVGIKEVAVQKLEVRTT